MGSMTCFVALMVSKRLLVKLKLGVMGAVDTGGVSGGAAAVLVMRKIVFRAR